MFGQVTVQQGRKAVTLPLAFLEATLGVTKHATSSFFTEKELPCTDHSSSSFNSHGWAKLNQPGASSAQRGAPGARATFCSFPRCISRRWPGSGAAGIPAGTHTGCQCGRWKIRLLTPQWNSEINFNVSNPECSKHPRGGTGRSTWRFPESAKNSTARVWRSGGGAPLAALGSWQDGSSVQTLPVAPVPGAL